MNNFEKERLKKAIDYMDIGLISCGRYIIEGLIDYHPDGDPDSNYNDRQHPVNIKHRHKIKLINPEDSVA